MTQTIKFFKETALPGTLQAHSVYYIAPASKPNYVEIYVTDALANARRVINSDDITSLIRAEVLAMNEIVVVANIAARNALELDVNKFVFVIDATGDNTVASGGATYLYKEDTTSWVKISEAESLDLQVTWSALQGKPTSTPAEIDDAVSKRHTHANKTQLDKIGEDVNGNLLYNNSLPYTGWDTTSW